jgi:argininosuccinate lyase
MADYLVAKGIPFREAHRCVGEVVRHAASEEKELQSLSLAELKGFSQAFEEDVFEILTLEQMIGRRVSAGGTARVNVEDAIKEAREALELEAAENESYRERKRGAS